MIYTESIMQGGPNKQPLGYTIVEVLIVLAISSAMFAIAANFISGKQEHTSFTQGVNETASRLQDIIEQVTDGHYSDVPLTCSQGAGLTINDGSPTPGQGRNQDCVFLGKIIHFYRDGTPDPQNYEIFSLADARSANGQLPNPFVAFIPTLTTQSVMPQNLEVDTVIVKPANPALPDNPNAFNIGFAQGLGTADPLAAVDPSAPTYKSGAQNVSLVYAPTGLDRNTSKAGGEDALTLLGGSQVNLAKEVTICVSDRTRSANILIGGALNNGNQLSIRVQQLGLVSCP